ncbi:hypothetical protein LguiA_026190 [Lonicera macranthoides]
MNFSSERAERDSWERDGSNLVFGRAPRKINSNTFFLDTRSYILILIRTHT